MNRFDPLDPATDTRANADEANAGLLWHMRLRADAARTPAQRAAARDLVIYRGALCRWSGDWAEDLRTGEMRALSVTVEPVTPAEIEARLTAAVEAIEADPQRFRRDADASTLLRYWRAWGQSLPADVAQAALETASAWLYPVLAGRGEV